MFVLKRGKTKFVYLPVTTSTALSAGALVTFTSGLLVAATSSTAASAIVGVVRHAIASTDSDYATARKIEVEVPVERFTEWEADTASAVSTDIGVEEDLTDSLTVNRGAQSVKVFLITSVPSATKIRGCIKFLGSY